MTEKYICELCTREDKHEHLAFFKNEKMLQDGDFDIKNGRSSLGSWSQYEIWSEGRRVGWLENGYPDFTKEAREDGFEAKIIESILQEGK